MFDKKAVFQVIGCLINQPSLLDTYLLSIEDFDGEDFHQIIFGCIYNLYNQGVNVIDCFSIDTFISNYEKQYKIFTDNNGIDYVNDAAAMCEPQNFDYNFNRLKKMSRFDIMSLRDLIPEGFMIQRWLIQINRNCSRGNLTAIRLNRSLIAWKLLS